MTITADATVTAPVATAPRMAFTMPAKAFVGALKNVAPFASTDTTMPVLCGIKLEMDNTGTLTFIATDRYVIATQVVTMEEGCRAGGMRPANPPCTGSGAVFLVTATVKALSAVKAVYRELITLTVAADGAVTVALPDTTVVSYPSADAYTFPEWRRIAEQFHACPEGDVPGVTTYNPAFLGKFAKIKPTAMLTITPGLASKDATVSTISRAVCGEVTAYIMQIRKS